MKRIFSLLLALLLLSVSFGCTIVSRVTQYANAGKYTAGGFTYEASDVKRVEVDWAGGDVTLSNGTGRLSVSESGGDALATSERLHWWLDGTTLRIKYCESGYTHIISTKNKHLYLQLPADVELKIDLASGGIDAETLEVGSLDVNKASGGMKITSLRADEIRIDSASGSTELHTVSVRDTFRVDTASGGLSVEHISANTVKVDSASGGVRLGLDAADTVDIDVASGKVSVKLWDAARGATVRLGQLAGTFDCKLPMTASGKTYLIGGGETQINIDSASGGVTIE